MTEEKFIQHLLSESKYFSTEDLAEKLEDTNIINKTYATLTNNGWIYKDKLEEYPAFDFKTRLLDKEVFIPYPNEPKIKVSNKGRILIGNKIQKQIDIKPLAGYLYLKDYKEIKNKYKIKFENIDWIYQLVAKTWLLPPPNDGNTWDIHHISNDGYDNTPENLIWVERTQHQIIHAFKKKNHK